VTLTAHRPARPLSSLQGEDPAELDVSLPGLPHGVTLDPEVLRGAACGEQDLELFYPDPGDLETERAAKQVCAGCPVKQPCLEMALATGDQHAILGGTTPQERGRLRRQRQVTHARQQAAQRATAATGIDPAQVKAPTGRSMAAHLRGDASATVRAWELCKTAGTAHVARLIGVHVTDLHAAEEALALAIQLGVRGAAERLGVDKATLYLAWRRWGLGRPTDRPEGARATAARKLAASRRADRARHPWTLDRSIWQPTRPTSTAERATAGAHR
jgi:WhiB family transcriptional regulator, redox-sensing transcriptional regulator